MYPKMVHFLALDEFFMYEADSSQLNCLADLVLISFMECLLPGEVSISINQILMRNLTPHEQATRDCICFLYRQGRVKISPVMTKRVGRVVQVRDTKVELKISAAEVPKLIINLSYGMRGKITDSKSQDCIGILDDQLKVYECIEYSRYYLCREGLDLAEKNTPPYKLILMVMDLPRQQIFMLLWRAVKTANTIAVKKKERYVSLDTLCNLAYKYYLEYRKRESQIEFYHAPSSVDSSTLRGVLTKYR